MADNNEPMNDKQLEVLGQEIAIPLQAHPAGPVAQLAQRNAWASLNYLIQQYQRLRATVERKEVENAAMLPIVQAVASPLDVVREHVCMCEGPYDGPHKPHCIVAQARAFVAAHSRQERG